MRAAMVFRLGWGTALLAFPCRVLRATGRQQSSSARRVLRVLGARHLAQAVVCWRAREPDTALAVGAAADALHAVSCLAIACVSPTWRRGAAIDFVIAAALATDGVSAVRQQPNSTR